MTLKKGEHLFEYLEMNLFKAACMPIRHCTSFFVQGDGMSSVALFCSGFTSIPFIVTKYPRNLLAHTIKVHFTGVKSHVITIDLLEYFFQILDVGGSFWRFDDHAIDVNFSYSS